MRNDDKVKTDYYDGLDAYVDAITGGDEEKPKTDYKRKIIERAAAIRKGEWKLRKKSPDKGNSTPTTPKTPTIPKTPNSTPKPKAHGEHPQAPAGMEYYWSDYQPKGKGV